jgi:hypothetical protein
MFDQPRAELHLVDSRREILDKRTDLTASQRSFGYVPHERGTRPVDEAKPEGTGLRPCPFVILEGSDKPGK